MSAEKHAKLIEIVRRKYKSQTRFAQALGWSVSKANKALNGGQPWSDKDITQVAQVLDMSSYSIARLVQSHAFALNDPDEVAIVGMQLPNFNDGSAGWDEPVDDEGLGVWKLPKVAMKAFTNSSADRIAMVQVKGNAMSPMYNPGDFLMIDNSVTSPASTGDYLINTGVNLELRIVEPLVGFKDPTVELRSYNSVIPARQVALRDLNISGRVIGHCRPR